ncbi:DGCR2, partial [Cervus elaphus hippelaphus]
VSGQARPHHGKEAADPRPGRAHGGDPSHLHAMSVAQPVRFGSKLQACPGADPGRTPRHPETPRQASSGGWGGRLQGVWARVRTGCSVWGSVGLARGQCWWTGSF